MELLKPEVIIDPIFKPDWNLDYLQYFIRAMSFAQTNYAEELSKLANLHFRKMTPIHFFNEYTWIVCCTNSNPKEVSKYFLQLEAELTPYYARLAEMYMISKKQLMKEYIIELTGDENKFHAINYTSDIVNRGIKLFGWDRYRSYLDSASKLQVFPLMNEENAKHLSFNIGLTKDFFHEPFLQEMATHWGFASVSEMCRQLHRNVNLQEKVIALILWYSGATFGTS